MKSTTLLAKNRKSSNHFLNQVIIKPIIDANSFESKKTQTVSTIKESNFLNPNTTVVFSKSN